MVTGKRVDEIFTIRFRQCLDNSSYTRKAFAETIGVTEQSIQRWLTGAAFPTMLKIQDIANTLGVSPQWLFGADEASPTRDAIISKITNEIHDLKSIEALEGVYMLIQRLKEEVADSQKKMTKEN